MKHFLTFNNVNLSDFDCYIDGSQEFRTPQKMVSMYSVVGRNGDLAVSQGRYSNITIPFNCFINKNFKENYSALVNLLHSIDGYARLETTHEPDVYRMGLFSDEIDPNPWQFNRQGTFTLNFNCKPQKWLKSGENAISVTNTLTVFNPTEMTAKPLLKVKGTGTITINDSQLVLNTNTSTTYIDCEIQDAYEGTINRNPNLTILNGFPELKKGENKITVSGCTVDLIPRWWKL